MKKIVMIATVAIIAGAVSADLAVEWKSTVGAIEGTEGANDFLEGSTIQLIWSAAGAFTTAGEYDLSTLSETVLKTGVTGANSLWNLGSEEYAGDYTGGSFFTRIFQDTGAAGEYFLDIPMGDGANYVYDPLSPATVYNSNVAPGGITWVGSNGTVPEPATVGLFGLGALSAWFIRRSKKAQKEEEA